ncbi:hypothetical protein TNCV_2204501 [Trichonephila clavipes]|nr:hypothetical protein TNCV_2204501 [Trichonephila clavipes]
MNRVHTLRDLNQDLGSIAEAIRRLLQQHGLSTQVDGFLGSLHFISGVLRPVTLSFIRALRNPTFQLDNARSHFAGIVQIFLDTENFQQMAWPARSPVLSLIQSGWPMSVERLSRHHTPITTVDELWYGVEAACLSVPQCFSNFHYWRPNFQSYNLTHPPHTIIMRFGALKLQYDLNY